MTQPRKSRKKSPVATKAAKSAVLATELAKSFKDRYTKLEATRSPYLERGRNCAKLTLPAILPPTDDMNGAALVNPQQSIGSQGVNVLASKFLMALFPPDTAFFRYRLSEDVTNDDTGNADDDQAIDQLLSIRENRIMEEINFLGIRMSLSETFKHLLIVGNVLLHLTDTGLKLFQLNKFVVRRDGRDKVMEIVIKEKADPATLDEEVCTLCGVDGSQLKGEKDIEIYTRIWFDGPTQRYYEAQQINGISIPDSVGDYPEASCPWKALRMIKLDGEDYGMSYVEQYFGDLATVEDLTLAITEAGLASAKIVHLVEPNSVTNIKKLNEAPNGAYVAGHKDDISTVQIEKYHDLQIPFQVITKAEERLAFAFMLNSAIQRNGERVTAEEIRWLAGEIEATQTGSYTLLAEELQKWFVLAQEANMIRNGTLTLLPEGATHIGIVTGLEALGRTQDLQKLQLWTGMMKEIFGEEVGGMLKRNPVSRRIATALNFNIEGLVMTDDELSQQAQEQEQTAMMQTVLPAVIGAQTKGGGPMAGGAEAPVSM